MNVSKGDMAVVVWPGKSANNHFVDVLEYIAPGSPAVVNGKQYKGVDAPAWWVRCASPVRARDGAYITEFAVRDANLRPIGTPHTGGVEQSNFQRPVPSEAELLKAKIGAINEYIKNSRSQS